MKTVLVTASELAPEALAILRDAGFTVRYMAEPIGEAQLIAALQAEPISAILLRGDKPITRAVICASPHIKLIAKNGVGINSVDVSAAKELGIAVQIASGANASAVAEGAVAMMLSLMRDLHGLNDKLRSGGWEGASYRGRDFAGSTVGIVGYGEIGKRTAQLASALGAKVLVHRLSNPHTPADDFELEPKLDNLLLRVDVLSLHCPLTEQTRHLISTRELALMKPSSFLVNTARGGVVDEAALIAALQNKRLAGAALDVFALEPLPIDSPLRQLPNVILTPHVSGVTVQAAKNVGITTAKNVVAFFGAL